MNTSKTTLKKPDVDNTKKVKKVAEGGGSALSLKTIILGAIAVIVVIALIVGISIENLKPRLVMTINDDKINMSEAAYYIYQTEASYSYMDQLYQAYYGSSYWDQTGESGLSNRESAKTETENTIEQYYVLYQEAVKAGYEINDDDKKSAASDVKSIRKNLTFEQKNMTGMSKKALTKVLEQKYCADRYKQDTIDGFDIDDDKIRDGVSYDDYKQYDVQYYHVSTKTTDKDGNQVDVDDETKALYKAELDSLAEKATTEDFDSLTPEAVKATKEADVTASPEASPEATDADSKDDTTYYSQFTADGKFVAGDGTFTTDVEKVLTKMNNDQISEVIEADDGYYLVKMVNNDDKEAYETEVKNQISTEENKQFDTWYQDVFANYTVTLNSKVWDEVVMGKTFM